MSTVIQHRVGIAVAVFVSAFLTAYLQAKGGITTDVLIGAVLAGVSAVAHWLVNQLSPLVDPSTPAAAPAAPVSPAPSPGTPPIPGAPA
jgi:ABC-type Mn2+/Zn2+ transport system permease subunit